MRLGGGLVGFRKAELVKLRGFKEGWSLKYMLDQAEGRFTHIITVKCIDGIYNSSNKFNRVPNVAFPRFANFTFS